MSRRMMSRHSSSQVQATARQLQGVVDGFNLGATPDYRANADVADAVESTHLTGWFDTVDYIGAVGPDELDCWLDLPRHELRQ